MEDQLRRVIRDSGIPQSRISRAAKMDEGTLSCFMLGKQESVRLKTAQRLAAVLGMQLVLEPKPKATPSRKRRKTATPSAKTKKRRRRKA